MVLDQLDRVRIQDFCLSGSRLMAATTLSTLDNRKSLNMQPAEAAINTDEGGRAQEFIV
jgi:hypothetical protein